MRLLGYLKKTPPTWEFARGQAALALKYVQHAEGRGLKALQLGRTASDDAYEAGVIQLRQEMAQVSSAKARVLLAEHETGSNGKETKAE